MQPDAEAVVRSARAHGVFVRNVGNMGATFGGRAVRVAVKNRASMAVVLDALRRTAPMAVPIVA